MRKSSREVQEKYKNIVDLKKKKVLSFEGSGSTKKKKKAQIPSHSYFL